MCRATLNFPLPVDSLKINSVWSSSLYGPGGIWTVLGSDHKSFFAKICKIRLFSQVYTKVWGRRDLNLGSSALQTLSQKQQKTIKARMHLGFEFGDIFDMLESKFCMMKLLEKYVRTQRATLKNGLISDYSCFAIYLHNMNFLILSARHKLLLLKRWISMYVNYQGKSSSNKYITCPLCGEQILMVPEVSETWFQP